MAPGVRTKNGDALQQHAKDQETSCKAQGPIWETHTEAGKQHGKAKQEDAQLSATFTTESTGGAVGNTYHC